MNITNKEKKNKTNSDRVEEMFARLGLKVVWVEKTGARAVFSNKPVPNNKKSP